MRRKPLFGHVGFSIAVAVNENCRVAARKGVLQTFNEAGMTLLRGCFSCFVNLLQSEEARKQIVLVVDGPAAGKAKAFPQPQHRFETRDRSTRSVE